jgi:hypothetical protein
MMEFIPFITVTILAILAILQRNKALREARAAKLVIDSLLQERGQRDMWLQYPAIKGVLYSPKQHVWKFLPDYKGAGPIEITDEMKKYMEFNPIKMYQEHMKQTEEPGKPTAETNFAIKEE